MSGSSGISVLILTYNEAVNIGQCLESVSWSDDVVVLDSFSDDETVNIAREHGARVYQRAFDDYARQRNYGINEISYRNPWLAMIDADEVVSPELATEMADAVQNAPASVCMFRMRNKNFLMGRWIRRSSGYPVWLSRLMRIGSVRIEREINEHCETDGEVRFLENHLLHYSFNKGFAAWLDKHNRYSTMEAERLVNLPPEKISLRVLFNRDPAIRRKAFKTLFYSMPGRPLIMFLGLYFIKGGMLEGRAGLIYALLKSYYEFMISCKVIEFKRRSGSLPL